jgi:4-hydroxy-2-oxoheptanedioate aldolase
MQNGTDPVSLSRLCISSPPALGLGLRIMSGALGARAAAAAGFDWLFLDLEHGQFSFDRLCETMLAAHVVGLVPVVRMGSLDPAFANRVLTNGATALIFPHVDTPSQAATCAAACRFAPQGIRGVPAFFPQLGFVKPELGDATRRLNDMTNVVVMIESAEAVANAEAIAATEGVDMLFVGASDLTVQFGRPGVYLDSDVQAALTRVADACAAHSKLAGFGGIWDPEIVRDLCARGFSCVLAGNDLDLLVPAARARSSSLRSE